MGMSRNSKMIIAVAMMASLLEIIDSSIVNVAIPTMMGNLGATLEDISMVVTGYAIANAIVLPVSAWMSERIGRRRYFLGCILFFTIVSVACGIAPNLGTLIFFRILQGLAGGALLPTSQALIYEQFPKEKAGIAGAMFGMVVMIGPALGPTAGGYLTDNFGWRSIFNINLPLGILALVVGSIVIHDVHTKEQKAAMPKSSIDFLGLALITIGIGCLQLMLERGEAEDWFATPYITVCACLAAICLPAFVWWELKVKDPIINIRLFKQGIVASGVGLMAAVGFFLYALVFVLPVWVGRALHYDATQTGTLFIPGSLLTAAMMPFIGRQLSKRDPRAMIAVGLVAIEVCLIMLTNFSLETDRAHVMQALYVRGFAMAFLFVPINSTILSQFRGKDLGQVSGLLNLSRQIGGSIGIALVSTLLTSRGHQNYADLRSQVTQLSQPAQNQFRGMKTSMAGKMPRQVGEATPETAAYQSLYYRMQNQVFMMSFIQLMWILAGIFLLAFIPLMALKVKHPVKAVDAH